MLHLSTIRPHFDSGFSSVVSLVDDLERQIENLNLANQSPNHFQHLEETISNQQHELARLSETISNKSKESLKLHQTNYKLQQQLQLKTAPTKAFIIRSQNEIKKLQLQLSETNQFNLQLKTQLRELEQVLESDNLPTIKLDTHNSSLPPSLGLPWEKLKCTKSLRQKSGLQIGGQFGNRGSTLLQVHQPELVILHQVKDCQHCHYSLISSELIRFNKRQIFEIENGRLTVIEHQTEVKRCSSYKKISKGQFPKNLKAPVQYGTSVFSRIVYLNQYQLLPVAQTAICGSPKPKNFQLSARSLYGRFIRNKDLILKFMTDFRLPFDENGAERDLRMLKFQQKISGCFRSIEGVKVFYRFRSYLSSARKQGRGLIITIASAIRSMPITFTT